MHLLVDVAADVEGGHGGVGARRHEEVHLLDVAHAEGHRRALHEGLERAGAAAVERHVRRVVFNARELLQLGQDANLVDRVAVAVVLGPAPRDV